jgi:hypothetical protein
VSSDGPGRVVFERIEDTRNYGASADS